MTRISGNKSTKSIYIFCEGFTEEYYFKFIKTLYRQTPVNIESIRNLRRGGEFKNIRKLNKRILNDVKKIEDKKLKGFSIKKNKVKKGIYAVFDLDIFSQKEIDDLYSGIDESITLIPTNMCFEYWILSHFEKYNFQKGKSKYLLEVKKYLPNLENDKFTGSKDFEWLNEEYINIAIENIKEVNDETTGNVKDRDPYSNVYKIIEFLEK